jgi:beta-lactamase superfamily II metal-dependent hydrolase
MSKLKLPDPGFIFWPVGCGDSTTVVINKDTIVQIDVHHVADAEGEDDPRVPIVDRLVELLPKKNGKPYLAAFGATHLDRDHVQGFADLLDRVLIGDLWFTPRILWEQKQDDQAELCEDAKAFEKEAERRIKLMKKQGAVGSGDRIRIIGYNDVLKEHSDIYKDLPEGAVTIPGSTFTHIDGEDQSERFSAFVHAPFKDDTEGERNDTSFALQVTLTDGEDSGRALLLGDLSYPTLKRIFDRSKKEKLAWGAFLTPHHCSKSAMYWKGEDDDEEKLKRDILEAIEKAKDDGGYIIASSTKVPSSDEKGANPPHAKAAKRYRELVDDGHFLCTAEHPSESSPEPIVFELDDGALVLRDGAEKSKESKASLAQAVQTARGAAAPAAQPVGFGRR